MVERIGAMDKAEPPSAGRANSLFRIGKNRRGQWVVQNQTGLCGGLFVSRAEAVKFAMVENGNRPQAVIMVPGILELDMSGKPHADGSTSGTHGRLARAPSHSLQSAEQPLSRCKVQPWSSRVLPPRVGESSNR